MHNLILLYAKENRIKMQNKLFSMKADSFGPCPIKIHVKYYVSNHYKSEIIFQLNRKYFGASY